MAYYATPYTIHFDDTMAYGGHHFLTSFKFQCASREAFLFGDKIFDLPGVKEDLDKVHLLTSDAYSRNLQSARLGDRVVILLSLEDWGRASARFCYRVLDIKGRRVCAGFQTLICADAASGNPIPLPQRLREAMDAVRSIEELRCETSFRDRVLAGGTQLDHLFGDAETEAAIRYLSHRYPAPGVIAVSPDAVSPDAVSPDAGPMDVPSPPRKSSVPTPNPSTTSRAREAWVFAGQGAFDPGLLIDRVKAYRQQAVGGNATLDDVATVTRREIGYDASALVGDSVERCEDAVRATPELSQVAIHLQNVLGAELWSLAGHTPAVLLGHSFGEIGALGVAGCFDIPTGIQIVCRRGRAVSELAPTGGGLMVVFASRDEVATELRFADLDRIVVAGRNHDSQTVLSGPTDQLDLMGKRLRLQGVGSTRVPSPTAFHHPDLQAAAAQWRWSMRSLAIGSPSKTVYSPIGRRFLIPGEDIAAVLASQLMRPFDLQGGISDLVATGIEHFVDCGSTGSLGNLITAACPSISTVERPEFSPANHAASPASDMIALPRIAIVGRGCILPGSVTSPETLLRAIQERRPGIVDVRDFDSDWSADFYSEKLVPDRSTSHLTGRVDDDDIVAPQEVDSEAFDQFSRTQKLLCIALAPCVESLEGATRVVCLIGATADGFEDQDKVSSLILAGIDPTDPFVDERMETTRSTGMTPHSAVQEVFDRMVRPGLQVTLIDAACASSLYSTALGMQLLENDQADAVISGGCFCPGPGKQLPVFSIWRDNVHRLPAI